MKTLIFNNLIEENYELDTTFYLETNETIFLYNLTIFPSPSSIYINYHHYYHHQHHINNNNLLTNTTNHDVVVTSKCSDWGPKRDPLYIIIPISIIYVIIFFCGVLGNISTCIVIARNRSMHTATNYYLFSLAISDLLLLISGLPPEIYSIWSKYPYIFGEPFCVLQGFAAETSANATVLTITTFTIERYLAICHPFLAHTLSKLNRAIRFIIAIWIIAMCLAIPQAMAFGVVCERLDDGTYIADHCICMIKRSVIPHAFEISTFVFFIAPMSLITILYILIGIQLHRTNVGPSRGNSVKMKHHRLYRTTTNNCTREQQQQQQQQAAVLVLNDGEKIPINTNSCCGGGGGGGGAEEDGRKNFAKNAQATKHVVKMLIAVVLAFFICWAPFHAQRLLAIYGERTSARMIRAFQILTYVSGVFYYLSTTVNPLLYHIMSNKFREAFKNTYKQWFQKGHRVPGGRCYSTLSARSSQLNSHSNTDSYSRQCSLRYLDAEMARLHDNTRPLVVSFRRKKPSSSSSTTTPYNDQKMSPYSRRQNKQVIVFDKDLEEALNTISMKRRRRRDDNDCSFIEVHNLQPTHICPFNNGNDLGVRNYGKTGNMKSFNNHNNLVKIRSSST